MNPMTNHRPGHSIARAIIIMMCVAALLSLFGCTNNAMRTPEPIVDGEGREFITLRTGQICEVKKQKIVACERNTYRYAEILDIGKREQEQSIRYLLDLR